MPRLRRHFFFINTKHQTILFDLRWLFQLSTHFGSGWGAFFFLPHSDQKVLATPSSCSAEPSALPCMSKHFHCNESLFPGWEAGKKKKKRHSGQRWGEKKKKKTTMHSHMERHRRTHAEKVRKGIISFLSVSLEIGAAESLGGKRWQVICTDERGRKTVRGWFVESVCGSTSLNSRPETRCPGNMEAGRCPLLNLTLRSAFESTPQTETLQGVVILYGSGSKTSAFCCEVWICNQRQLFESVH